MIKFLILCAVFILLYFGFTTISDYNSALSLTLFDYQIETTLFAFALIAIAGLLVFMIVFRSIFWIFNIPNFLRQKWKQHKLISINKNLLYSLAEMIMGNRQKSIELVNKLIPDIDEKHKEIINLILAEAETSFDKKILYLRYLSDKKHYSIYASKKLAVIFYENGHYKQAEESALKAFNEKDTDTEAMLILIRIYAALGAWKKLVYIVSKLQRADVKLLEKHSKEIAKFYYLAAKSSLQSEDDDEAKLCLESALEMRPDYIEALELFVEISINSRNIDSVTRILKAAFSAKPSFEIAKIYIANSSSSPDTAYDTLANIADPVKYSELFLALSAYFGLQDKVARISGPKLITYDSSKKE